MKYNSLYPILFFIFFVSIVSPVLGQWSGTYGNGWINYDSRYLKLSVSEAGLSKVALTNLPADFSNDPSSLQLWHKGKEVSIVHVDSKEFWFYAELNDGSSDSLFFRPGSSRMNPYQSFFSDQGVYFLTTKANAKRSKIIEKSPLIGTPEPYSLHTEVKSLRNQFSFSTLTASPLVPNNSYYENINTWTGPIIYGDSAVGHNANNVVSNNLFTLTNYLPSEGVLPVLNLMVNGLHHGKHNIRVSVGKTSNALNQRELTLVSFSGLGGVKKEGLTLSNDDLSAGNDGVISLRSNSADTYDWFSLTYYTLTYPQKVKMTVGKSSHFNFPASFSTSSRIKIETATEKAVVLDISNPSEPQFIRGTYSGGFLEMMVPRVDKQSLRLLSIEPEQIKPIASDKISLASFLPVFSSPSFTGNFSDLPKAYDYLIITSDTLKEAAIEYAKYRSSSAGGGYKTIVFDSKTIYDQFNYGEPSAVGVKRFVEYMLKAGIRDNHNLLLVGISVTAPDAAGLRLKKDLPNEVPTIGDPGADILLVSGLHGGGQDTPAIPLGRISAFNQQQVLNYLEKVKEFEADRTERRWQKNVLHLSGGKTSGEINQLSSILRGLNPLVEGGEFAGSVKSFVKQSTIETERVDISNEVNEGVGLISYFGHGSPIITDLDMGKVSDVGRKYNNPGKYPLMYFNGCGVGNVYSGRSTITLSTDWLLTPKMGAIASIANSYNSYVSPTSRHLKFLYEELFVDGQPNQTIGRVLQNVALRVLKSNPDSYDITNIHQSNLQGDPAIRLFSFVNPDYSFDEEKPIVIISETPTKKIGNSSKLNVGAVVKNGGRYLSGQNIPIRINYYYNDGRVEAFTEVFTPLSTIDTVFFTTTYQRSIKQIQIVIDPDNTIQETRKDNNISQLLMDWNVADKLSIYPEDPIKDIIPPMVRVTFNNRIISNKEILPVNAFLKIVLEDNEALSLDDPSLLEVYFRKCWNDDCEYEIFNFDSANLVKVADNRVQISSLLSDWKSGIYELLINGKDMAGNRIVSGYKIQFTVEEDVPLSITVSPNPATDFVKFEAQINDYETVESVSYLIYNASGKIISRSDVQTQYEGKNVWYWIPENSPPGLYLYRIEVSRRSQKPTVFVGKFILL